MKFNLRIILSWVFLSFIVIACLPDEENREDRIVTRTVDMIVDSKTIMANSVFGAGLSEHLQLTLPQNNEKRIVQANGIAGFEYETGFEYKLRVEEKAIHYAIQPQDVGNPVYSYTLVEVLSKEKKE